MPFFEDDPLSRKRRETLLFLLGVALILAVIALLFFGQAWLDKRKHLSLARQAPTAMTALSTAGPAPASDRLDQLQEDPVIPLLRDAFQLLEQKQFDAALGKVNAALQVEPQNLAAYGLRGNIYAKEKLWDQAEKDFRTVLHADGKNAQVKFNLAELQFMQKRYDEAQPGFLALEQNPDIGDLAAYKVFLCDLLAPHEEVAARELDDFNRVGSNASYYFANAAWFLVHHKTEDARGWLMSAARIYAPNKFKLYAATLIELGYMPLPPPPQP